MIIRYKKECDLIFSFSFNPTVTMPRGLIMNSSPGIQMKLLSTPHFSQSPPLNQTADQGVVVVVVPRYIFWLYELQRLCLKPVLCNIRFLKIKIIDILYDYFKFIAFCLYHSRAAVLTLPDWCVCTSIVIIHKSKKRQ